MFDIVARLASPAPGELHKADNGKTPDSLSASLYDQILRSVLQSMQAAVVPVEITAEPVAALPESAPPSLTNRTLEDILAQRRLGCSLHDASAALPMEQIALHQQSLNHSSNPLLSEQLTPWELLMDQLTLQQRLAG